MDVFQSILVHAYDVYTPLFWVLIAVLGGVFGSFLTCMLYRVPRKISLSNPPSICPSCETVLTFWDLMPILSYVFSRGKCRHCGVNVSARYVLIELLTVTCFVLAFYVIGPVLWLPLALTGVVSSLFVVLLWVESRQVATKVLLFSITLFVLMFAFMR